MLNVAFLTDGSSSLLYQYTFMCKNAWFKRVCLALLAAHMAALGKQHRVVEEYCELSCTGLIGFMITAAHVQV